MILKETLKLLLLSNTDLQYRLYVCTSQLYVVSPTSDGSAAAVLVSEEFVKRHGLEKQAVEILGQQMVTDLPMTFDSKSCMTLVGYDMSEEAGRRLYAQTGQH